MERLISCRTLLLFLESNILHHTQHGFLKGRSTCTNLMECMNDWTLSIQYKRLVTVVYIDFSKAFDVVSHDKLLIRLAAYGITGTLLKWSQNFLSNRIHCTRVGSALSSSAELISGVIQGSGIGPCSSSCTSMNLPKILEDYGITTKFFCRWFQVVRRDYWYCWHYTVTSRPGRHGTVSWDMAVKTVHWQMLCSTYWTIPDSFYISTVLVTFLHSLWSPASRCYTLSWSRSHYCQQLSTASSH